MDIRALLSEIGSNEVATSHDKFFTQMHGIWTGIQGVNKGLA